uniref:Uncharacterized protein n=1 Tax=Romanomermis culicivorax TaxID=13658 RepID=A0A915LA97_ROMCU
MYQCVTSCRVSGWLHSGHQIMDLPGSNAYGLAQLFQLQYATGSRNCEQSASRSHMCCSMVPDLSISDAIIASGSITDGIEFVIPLVFLSKQKKIPKVKGAEYMASVVAVRDPTSFKHLFRLAMSLLFEGVAVDASVVLDDGVTVDGPVMVDVGDHINMGVMASVYEGAIVSASVVLNGSVTVKGRAMVDVGVVVNVGIMVDEGVLIGRGVTVSKGFMVNGGVTVEGRAMVDGAVVIAIGSVVAAPTNQ